MKFQYILLCLITSLLMPTQLFSQESVNDYKYVVVPNQYDFLKEKNQYQLNALTEFLFNKYGYTAFLEDEDLPVDLVLNKCLALYVDVKEQKGGMFKTKLVITLQDCKGEEVYSSTVGESRKKSFDKSYNEALRDAFKSYQLLNYVYQPNANILALSVDSSELNTTSDDQIIALKKELEALKAKEAKAVVEVVEVVEAKEIATVDAPKTTDVSKVVSQNTEVLYAQRITKGFQLVDHTPKVVYVILDTAKDNVFVVKNDTAIVYKDAGVWYYSKNNGSEVSVKTLQIKF